EQCIGKLSCQDRIDLGINVLVADRLQVVLRDLKRSLEQQRACLAARLASVIQVADQIVPCRVHLPARQTLRANIESSSAGIASLQPVYAAKVGLTANVFQFTARFAVHLLEDDTRPLVGSIAIDRFLQPLVNITQNFV